MRVLVTGAAGYIGSVVTELLVRHGHFVVGLDNLQSGHRQAVHPAAKFLVADLASMPQLRAAFAGQPIDAVVHLAGEALISESMTDPQRFFQGNVRNGLNLLQVMLEFGVSRLVFSSTAAVYGEPRTVPIGEISATSPVNAYGCSKLMFEGILEWYRRAYGLRFVAFRYFNAAGATADRGEDHPHETHLIPRLMRVALGREPFFMVYGSDYDTPDGTCIRDYVHVLDLAEAHVLSLEAIDDLGGSIFNLGTGTGKSVLEVIDGVRRVTGKQVAVRVAARRPGDPARLVATSGKIERELGWTPRHTDLETILATAWDWHRRHPDGYQ